MVVDRSIIRRIIENKQGHLSTEDQKTLEDWMALNDDNKAYVESFEDFWLKTGDYQPNIAFDPNKGFESFMEKVNAPSPIHELKPIKRFSFLKIAAGLFFLIMAGTIYFFSSANADSTRQLSSKQNEKSEITLADNSNVYLNTNSTITYFTDLNQKNRTLSLAGEAFFDVERIVSKPFIIQTHALTIEVLGTSFNVRDYKEGTSATVYVETGKVKVYSKKTKQVTILREGEHFTFNKESKVSKKTEDIFHNALAWRQGKLSFKKSPLDIVLKDIEQYFNISIVLENKNLADCPYTSLFNEPKKESMLAAISAAFNCQLIQEGESTYQLTGGSCD